MATYHLGQLVTTRTVGEIPGCKPAPRDETWLESQGLLPNSVADQYCGAIKKFLNKKLSFTERDMEAMMSMRNLNNAQVKRIPHKPRPGDSMWLAAEHTKGILAAAQRQQLLKRLRREP